MSSNYDDYDDDACVRASRIYSDGREEFHDACGRLFAVSDEYPYIISEVVQDLVNRDWNGGILSVDGTWYCSREASHQGQHEAWHEHEWVESDESHNVAITWGAWPIPILVEVP